MHAAAVFCRLFQVCDFGLQCGNCFFQLCDAAVAFWSGLVVFSLDER